MGVDNNTDSNSLRRFLKALLFVGYGGVMHLYLGAFINVSARYATERTPPERERLPARLRALATNSADTYVALYIQYGDRTNNF